MAVAVPREQKGSRVNLGAQAVLRVLERKPFFEHRFLGQVQALYGQTAPAAVPDVTASLYLNAMFERIPRELHDVVGVRASAELVNRYEACPSPTEVREILCDAVLAALKVDPKGLLERALLFLSCPPIEQAVADRWLERVIYTTVRRIGRDRFGSIEIAEWRRALSDTIVGDDSVLTAYQVPTRIEEPIVKRDLRGLVVGNG